jgi:hypothetical protein
MRIWEYDLSVLLVCQNFYDSKSNGASFRTNSEQGFVCHGFDSERSNLMALLPWERLL